MRRIVFNTQLYSLLPVGTMVDNAFEKGVDSMAMSEVCHFSSAEAIYLNIAMTYLYEISTSHAPMRNILYDITCVNVC